MRGRGWAGQTDDPGTIITQINVVSLSTKKKKQKNALPIPFAALNDQLQLSSVKAAFSSSLPTSLCWLREIRYEQPCA